MEHENSIGIFIESVFFSIRAGEILFDSHYCLNLHPYPDKLVKFISATLKHVGVWFEQFLMRFSFISIDVE